MSRTLSRLAFLLLAAIAVPGSSLRGGEQGQSNRTDSGQGTVVVTGGGTCSGTCSGTYSTGTLTISGGTLEEESSPLQLYGGTTATCGFGFYGGIGAAGATSKTFPTPIPAGPVFYVIIEGAGMGDTVRTVPCTGKETVLTAVGHVNGIPEVSNAKIWIARPSASNPNKSTILNVDWEAVSKRGINKTNYTLLPGDRLVLGEDPVITRTNLLAKTTNPIERVMGVVSLTTSTVNGLQSTPAATELIKELVRKGCFTDDEELKKIILDMIGRAEAGKTAVPKAEAHDRDHGDGMSGTASAQGVPGPKSAEGETSKTPGLKAEGGQEPSEKETGSQIAAEAAPHELAMRPLPAYRIEPPDVIRIEMHMSSGGPSSPSVTGPYLVGPDGTINLRKYGLVAVSGKTVAEARVAIQDQLKQFMASPELAVDVVGYNSKVYYIITQGGGLGDNCRRYPITGKETVLDALAGVNGLSQMSSKNIWVARPTGADAQKGRILRVDYDAITCCAATATNYQLMPGDRVFIAEDPLVAQNSLLNKKVAPLERTMGLISLTASTLRSLSNIPGGSETLKELVQKGFFTEDKELKKIVLDAIRRDEEKKKTAPR